jgi:hypothetical protein
MDREDSLNESILDLQQRLRLVQDRQEITDLVNRMARGFDRHDFDLVLSTWHSDGIEEHGDVVGSIADFVERAKSYLPESYTMHAHYVTNHVIDIEGDVAHFEAYILAAVKRHAAAAIELMGGRYVGRVERRLDKWRMVHRTSVGEWGGALAVVDWEAKTMNLRRGTWDKSDPSYQR